MIDTLGFAVAGELASTERERCFPTHLLKILLRPSGDPHRGMVGLVDRFQREFARKLVMLPAGRALKDIGEIPVKVPEGIARVAVKVQAHTSVPFH